MKAASKEATLRLLEEFSELGRRYQNPPKISLSLVSKPPNGEDVSARDIAIATAMQCYSPGETLISPKRKENQQDIADSTLDAGHHTTRQHAHFTFHVIGATREVTRAFFDDYPFYNTEQRSQRFSKIKPGAFQVPADLSPTQEAIFRKTGDYANEQFSQLEVLLLPDLTHRVSKTYPASWQKHPTHSAMLEKKAGKLTQENARYILPLAQETTYYYTVSHLQLLRLWSASRVEHLSDEGRFIVAQMILKVLEYDPQFIKELRQFPMETVSRLSSNQPSKEWFDSQFIDGKASKLLSATLSPREILAQSARLALGRGEDLDQSAAISLVIDPSKNPYLADIYDTGIHDNLTHAARSVNFVFATRLSHTAESQRQRHRRTPGVSADLRNLYDGTPDYVTPTIIRENPLAKELYDEVNQRIFAGINQCLDSGISPQDALLLLPNSTTCRVIESGDMYDFYHRFRQRTCLLAQGEIFEISVQQIQELLNIFPEARPAFQAPCGIRKHAGATPYCPEGDKWCGQPVYNWTIDDYIQRRLI